MQGYLKCAIYTRVSTDNQAKVEFSSCEAREKKLPLKARSRSL